jgi:hypothetical protein
MGLEQCCSNSLTLWGSKNRQFLGFWGYSRNFKEPEVFMKEPGSLEGSFWKSSKKITIQSSILKCVWASLDTSWTGK